MKEIKSDIVANIYLYPDKTKKSCGEAKSMFKSVLSNIFRICRLVSRNKPKAQCHIIR